MPIKYRKYVSARELLIKADCDSAEKSHKPHARNGDVPDRHGRELILEAIEEFQGKSNGSGTMVNGMNRDNEEIILKVARKLGINMEYLYDEIGVYTK